MGLTTVKTTLVNPSDESKLKQADMIVDTGSILTWAKRSLLSSRSIDDLLA
jgi:hypothetical protein